MFKKNCFLLLLLITTISYGISVCDEEEDNVACAKLTKQLEQRLLQDEVNLYEMRKAFYYSSTASPVLLKVVYTVTRCKSVADMLANPEEQCFCNSNSTSINPLTEDEQCCCGNNTETDVTSTTELTHGERCFYSDNHTIEPKFKNFTYGWTSSGVYTFIHPLTLSALQALIPFVTMRVLHHSIKSSSPEADTFLWDGSYELPTLHLNINISSLHCDPSEKLLDLALQDVTTLVR